MCFGHSKEPSHHDRSFEYPQHMVWLRNKNYHNNFQLHTLIWRPDFTLLSGYLINFKPLSIRNPIMGTLANIEDPDEMQHNAALH